MLIEEAAAWQDKHNYDKAKVTWQFTAKCARIKLKRSYPILLS